LTGSKSIWGQIKLRDKKLSAKAADSFIGGKFTTLFGALEIEKVLNGEFLCIFILKICWINS
jgi:hypothetical protein